MTTNKSKDLPSNGKGQDQHDNQATGTVSRLERDAEEQQAQAEEQQQQAKVIQSYSMDSWIDAASRRPDPDQLFGSLVREGELSVFFATDGIGKSTLAVQIGDAIAKGSSVFSALPNQKADPIPVNYLDFELSDKQLENRYKDRVTGSHKTFSSFLYRSEIKAEQLADKENPQAVLLDAIHEKATQAGLIIIDNLTMLLEEQEKSSDSRQLIGRLNQIKKQTGCAVLLIAHTPKRDHSEPLTKNDLAGSKNLSNLVDNVFVLGQSNQTDQVKYLKQIKTRSAAKTLTAENVATVQIDKTGPDLHFEFLRFEQEYEHLKTPKEAEEEQLENDAAQLYEEGYSVRQVMDKLGIKKNKAEALKKKVG